MVTYIVTVHTKELRPYHLNGHDKPEDIALRDKKLFIVESIIRHCTPNDKAINNRNKAATTFFVKWEGYEESENSWVTWKDLLQNAILLQNAQVSSGGK